MSDSGPAVPGEDASDSATAGISDDSEVQTDGEPEAASNFEQPQEPPAGLDDLRDTATELEHSEKPDAQGNGALTDGAKGAELPGLGLLTALLTVSLFCDLFERLAYRRSDLTPLELRVSLMAKDHPFFDKVCRWLDLAFRVLLMLMVLAATAFVIWGVLRRTFFYDGLLPGQGEAPATTPAAR